MTLLEERANPSAEELRTPWGLLAEQALREAGPDADPDQALDELEAAVPLSEPLIAFAELCEAVGRGERKPMGPLEVELRLHGDARTPAGARLWQEAAESLMRRHGTDSVEASEVASEAIEAAEALGL